MTKINICEVIKIKFYKFVIILYETPKINQAQVIGENIIKNIGSFV